MMLAALTLMWGCSSSSDKDDEEGEIIDPPFTATSPWHTVNVPPMWQIDWTGNDQRPNWEEPVPSKYESWMIVQVQLPNLIATDVSDDDLMAIFIDDEIRGLSSKATSVTGGDEEKTYFILKTFGNPKTDSNKNISIKYYSSKLHHLFTVNNGDTFFTSEGDVGVTHDFIPPFLLGASKYPVVMYDLISFTIDPESTEGFVPHANDIVAAFVGDECRGYTTVGESLYNARVTVTVYSKAEGEQVKIRYYSVNKNAVREFDTTVETRPGTRMSQISI